MKFKGIGLVMMAAVFWGVSGGIADILMNKGWDPTVISFYRGVVGLVFFLVWFLSRLSKNRTFNKRLFIWATLAGIGIAGNFTFYFLSIEHSSIAIAATLMYTAPVFVLLISFMFRIERSTWFKWGCIFGVLVGIILLTGAYDFTSISVSVTGAITGLAAGLSYALFIFGFKNTSSYGRPQSSLLVAFFVFCLILFAISDKQDLVSAMTSEDAALFLLLGIVGAGVSFFLYVIGIRHTTATTASMVAMVEPVTASLFGVLLLGDYLNMLQVLGMVLILVTITILSKKQSH
ncbi:DMT family transporter [Jeotgalibacillus haloalkalitolerans]|uniref:DMT family transporter n=1 Tax=Jeotgalibacillus haloalkalitolerans TaxID=3104292 RepID=A0ABU5KN57_9BACL|nr:DMT family transporter [Jeotgalibacillus sp. HH7-29]MDZ5712702.1 DMT family transporter [Jeotgalibacillus sp. HH7-29]